MIGAYNSEPARSRLGHSLSAFRINDDCLTLSAQLSQMRPALSHNIASHCVPTFNTPISRYFSLDKPLISSDSAPRSLLGTPSAKTETRFATGNHVDTSRNHNNPPVAVCSHRVERKKTV